MNELTIRNFHNKTVADYCHQGLVHVGFELRKREGMVLEDIGEQLSPT